MPAGILEELRNFFISAFWGMLAVVYYDFFRVLRIVIRHSSWMVAVEDLLFAFGAGCMLLAVSYEYDQGQLRGYLLLGMLCGAVIYNWGLSPYFIGMIQFFYKKGKQVLKIHTKQGTMNKMTKNNEKRKEL